MKVFRIAYAIQTGNAGNHDDVPSAGHQSRGCTQAQFLDFIIDAQVLLYISVGGGDVGFRLVIIVVGHEIFHRIVGEKGFEFPVELGRQCLVVAEYQCRTLQPFNDIGHCEGLARTRDSEQGDCLRTLFQSPAYSVYCGWLVSGRAVVRYELEIHWCKGYL